MLNASELNAVIKAAVGSGVDLALLLEPGGTVISSASADPQSITPEMYATSVAATTNLWRSYARSDLSINKLTVSVEESALEQVLLCFPDKKMCVMSVADTVVLCLVACNPAVEMGLLKLKAAAVQRELDARLRPLVVQP